MNDNGYFEKIGRLMQPGRYTYDRKNGVLLGYDGVPVMKKTSVMKAVIFCALCVVLFLFFAWSLQNEHSPVYFMIAMLMAYYGNRFLRVWFMVREADR